MKKILLTLLAGIFLFVFPCTAAENELAAVLYQIARKDFAPIAKNSIIVTMIKEANTADKKSLDEISELDRQWRDADADDPWVNSFQSNPCAKFLKNIQQSSFVLQKKLYAEIFVMDQQGLIVAETKRTTDYLQGDEDKFSKVFWGNHAGNIFIDEPLFDESTSGFLIHISLPVIDPDNKKIIGVLTVGIDLDALMEKIIK